MKNASLILSAFVGASIIGLSACTGDSAEQTPPADTTAQSEAAAPASEPTVVPNTNVQQTATEVEEADGDDKPVEPNKNPVEKASGDVRKGAQEVQKTATDVKETKKEVEKAAEDVKGIFKK